MVRLLLPYLADKNFKQVEGEENHNYNYRKHKNCEIMIRRLPSAAGVKSNFKHVADWVEDKLRKYIFPFPENLFVFPTKENNRETYGFLDRTVTLTKNLPCS